MLLSPKRVKILANINKIPFSFFIKKRILFDAKNGLDRVEIKSKLASLMST
jgi:hypothetical protein